MTAIQILLIILVLYSILIYRKEKFASKLATEIYQESNKYFDNTNNPKFTEYNLKNKNKLDFVEFKDIKDLWKGGNLNPDKIDSII